MDIKLILVAMLALWGCSNTVNADAEAVSTVAAALPRELLKNMLASERARRALFSRLTGLAATAVGTSAGTGSALAEAGSAVGELLTKPQPYQLSSVEMHTIKALASIQHLIGDIFSRVGISIPSIMKLINRRGLDASPLSAPASKSSNLGLLVRGLALSLPLIIPAVNQIRRQSHDNPLQQFAPVSVPEQQQSGGIQYSPEQSYQQYYTQQQSPQSLSEALQYHQQNQQQAMYDQQSQQTMEPMMQRRRGKRSIVGTEKIHLNAMQRELVQSLLQNRRVLEQLRLFAQKFEQ